MPFTKCPACGFSEIHGNSKITNYMSEYVDKVTGEVDGVFASVDPQLTVKDKVLVRKDLWVKPAPVLPPTNPTPTTNPPKENKPPVTTK